MRKLFQKLLLAAALVVSLPQASFAGRVVCTREMPTATSFATPDIRAGGSSPAETVRVWDFQAATDEFVDFSCYLAEYGGNGLTFTLVWSATTATTAEVVWQIAIRRMTDDAEDIDSAHTYVFNTFEATTASASGEVQYSDITFTDGADMDSWADEEWAIVRVGRDANVAGDDMSGDAELWGFIGKETP